MMKSGSKAMSRTRREGLDIRFLCSAVEHSIIACVIDKMLSEYFSALGRKSAKARLKKLSAKERREIAVNAAKARWKQKRRKNVKHKAGRKS
jgi:hypothetical protein